MLTFSVILMGISTFLIGLLPDATQIGVTATVLLVMLRILQGLSVGGEYTGSVTFVLEHAPDGRRAFAASRIGVGASLGFLIGSGVGTLIMSVFSQGQLESWAWRLPFLAGILIAVVGYLIRRHAPEPPGPVESEPLDTFPVVVAFRDEWRNMHLMELALAVNSGFYMMFVYATTYLTERMHVSVAEAMDNNTLNLNGTYLSPFSFAKYAQATEYTWKDGWWDDRLVATKHPTIIRSHQPLCKLQKKVQTINNSALPIMSARRIATAFSTC